MCFFLDTCCLVKGRLSGHEGGTESKAGILAGFCVFLDIDNGKSK